MPRSPNYFAQPRENRKKKIAVLLDVGVPLEFPPRRASVARRRPRRQPASRLKFVSSLARAYGFQELPKSWNFRL